MFKGLHKNDLKKKFDLFELNLTVKDLARVAVGDDSEDLFTNTNQRIFAAQ